MNTQCVKLTEEQLKKNTAKHLLTLLDEVSADGVLTDEEIKQMDAWLSHVDDEGIPAMIFLRTLIHDVLEDHVITEVERQDIVFAILRVMPDDISHAARLRYGTMFGCEDRLLGGTHVTKGQEKMMEVLYLPIPRNCTRDQACDLIMAAIDKRCESSGIHAMVLRFWGREDLVSYRSAACEWLDRWYAEDPDRYAAWVLWSKEHPECCSPESVTVGEGNEYLERLKAS